MNTLIIDDEPLARARLIRLLNAHPEVHILGEAGDGEEALSLFNKLKPELVFLDIEMPGMNGLSCAEILNQQTPPPFIILVTAHAEHALEAYRIAPLDYLLKPVDPNRLKTSIERLNARKKPELLQHKTEWISFKKGDTYQRIAFSDVLYFSSDGNLVKLVYDEGEAFVEDSLKHLETIYAADTLRIHRHLLVNKHKIVTITKKGNAPYLKLKDHDTLLPVSRRKVQDVKTIIHSRF